MYAILRWPDNTLSYEIDCSLIGGGLGAGTLQGLEAKLDDCITFREASSGNRVLVEKPSKAICRATVGYVDRDTQILQLGRSRKGNCYGTGTIEHEFLQALGVYHQQSRSDRVGGFVGL